MKRERKLSLVTPSARPLALLDRAEKLAAAIAYLNDKWVLHPKFDRKKLRVGLLAEWKASLRRYRP